MNKLFNLQLFSEGGDGGAASVGDGGAEGSQGVVSQSPADEIKGLPEHVRKKVYGERKAPATTEAGKVEESPATPDPQESAPVVEQKKPTLEELINSDDDYKEEHRLSVKKAVDDRWKKYHGIEDQLKSANEALEFVAFKYNLDPASKTFAADLKAAMEADDSFVQDYADKHDMPTEEARRVMQMQRKMERLERAELRAKQEAETRASIQRLVDAGKKTKVQFPEFDLDREMSDPKFVRLVQATNGNTTAAYIACHSNDVLARAKQAASESATNAVVASVKSNTARPVENGISSSATAVSKMDISDMTLTDFKNIQKEFKKTGIRPKF